MKMKNIIHIAGVFALTLFSFKAFAGTYSIKSPDGKIEASLTDGEKLTFSVKADGKTLVDGAEIAMNTDRGDLGVKAVAKGSSKTTHAGDIEAVFGTKKFVKDNYNQIEVEFKNFNIIVRAYDDSAAYRFVSKLGEGEIKVFNETLKLPLKDDDNAIAHIVKNFKTSFERPFTRIKVGELKKRGLVSMPFIFEKAGMKVALVESAWLDYPGLRISYKDGDKMPQAVFAPVPKTLKMVANQLQPDQVEDYIALTNASRAFPWRAFIIARTDADFVGNDTVYRLAEPSKIADTSWIKAGTTTWDWWVNWQTEGVDFKCKFDENMCKYYIDFAAENGIPFVTFDAGWHVDRESVDRVMTSSVYNKAENYFNGKPHVDIPAMVKYAESKGIKVAIWCLSKAIFRYPVKAMDMFKEWGVAGLKIDFNDRDDQWMIRYIEYITRLAAERKIIIDWHGAPAPSGFQRTYPNAVTFEAVYGLEMNKFRNPVTTDHNVDILFTRSLLGPFDYTPGGMRHKTPKTWKSCYDLPEVPGTRSHMAAHYVLFHSPLQMLSDMPSEYMRHPAILDFIAHTPTTWDDSVTLGGEMGKFVVVARRSGDDWYVGGIANEDGKKFTVDFAKFLPEGKYDVQIIRDTQNSNIIPADYKVENIKVRNTDKHDIEMKNGGGFTMKITPAKFLGIF